MKAAECFYCFRVFGNPDETRQAQVFEIASQSKLKLRVDKEIKSLKSMLIN